MNVSAPATNTTSAQLRISVTNPPDPFFPTGGRSTTAVQLTTGDWLAGTSYLGGAPALGAVDARSGAALLSAYEAFAASKPTPGNLLPYRSYLTVQTGAGQWRFSTESDAARALADAVVAAAR